MKGFLLIYFLFISAQTFAQQTNFEGTYKIGGKTSKDPFQLLEIHHNGDDTYFFYFEGGQGAPDYNGGSLYGRLTFNKENGNLEYLPANISEGCKLKFSILKDGITIQTAQGDCGFGYGVYADGTYKLTNKSNPAYFTDRHRKAVYFGKIAPEKYQK